MMEVDVRACFFPVLSPTKQKLAGIHVLQCA